MTVRDIAAEAGVSIATVSRALRGEGPVSESTRQRVEEAAARLGAVPPARRPRPADGAVYVRCPYLLSDYFGTIVSSIAESLDAHGTRLLLSAGDAAREPGVLGRLAGRTDVAGAVLILPPEPSAELEELRSSGFPFVVIDPRTELRHDIAAVSAAHFAGARSVTAHLTSLGHRRIGVIGGPADWQASRARLAGHASALAEAGVLPDPELVRHAEPSADQGHSAAGRLLDLPDRPTAIAAFNDKAAVGALRAAHERGLRVPADLSVAGFDDSYLSRSTVPALTTVRQPLEEFGRMAVSLLTRLLAGGTVETLHVELATHLVVRDSTGPVPPLQGSASR